MKGSQSPRVSKRDLDDALTLIRLAQPRPDLSDDALAMRANTLVLLARTFGKHAHSDKARFLPTPETREYHAKLRRQLISLIETINQGFAREGHIVPLGYTSLPPEIGISVPDPMTIFGGDSELASRVEAFPPERRRTWLELADLRRRLIALRLRCDQVDPSNPLEITPAELIEKPLEKELLQRLSEVYEELTGGLPGVTIDPHTSQGSGRFVDFAQGFYQRFLPEFPVPGGTTLHSRRNQLLKSGRLKNRRKITPKKR